MKLDFKDCYRNKTSSKLARIYRLLSPKSKLRTWPGLQNVQSVKQMIVQDAGFYELQSWIEMNVELLNFDSSLMGSLS